MRLILVLLTLLLAGANLNGCCPLSCLIAGSKSTPAKQDTPPKPAKGDKNLGKPIEKSGDQPQ
jgi:hypothetical protein